MSDTNDKTLGRGTLAVHAGVEPDPSTGAIMTPVYLTSTYVQDGVGNHKGYEYSRTHNPTRTALEKAFAELEYASEGLTFEHEVYFQPHQKLMIETHQSHLRSLLSLYKQGDSA